MDKFCPRLPESYAIQTAQRGKKKKRLGTVGNKVKSKAQSLLLTVYNL